MNMHKIPVFIQTYLPNLIELSQVIVRCVCWKLEDGDLSTLSKKQNKQTNNTVY